MAFRAILYMTGPYPLLELEGRTNALLFEDGPGVLSAGTMLGTGVT